MKKIVTETSLETNILLLLQPLLKFSSNILQIEYQMLVLAQTDLRKYEVTIGFLNGCYLRVRVSGSNLKWVRYARIPTNSPPATNSGPPSIFLKIHNFS